MWRGSSATDGQFAYFTPEGSSLLYQFQYSTEKWSDLPPCPYLDCGLVVIDGELTTVKGRVYRSHRTNKLFTLQQGKWVEKYPPMNTVHSDSAVVSTSDGDYIIVIGGYSGYHWTATVEIFQAKIRKWHELTDLPESLAPSATICGDQLNVIGDNGNGYSCSLQALPPSDKPFSSPFTLPWNPLPHLLMNHSTAATLCGQLVIIGGLQNESLVNTIHQLVDGDWVRIGCMASARRYCLVASPSPDKIIIVGGYGARHSVEECAVV